MSARSREMDSGQLGGHKLKPTWTFRNMWNKHERDIVRVWDDFIHQHCLGIKTIIARIYSNDTWRVFILHRVAGKTWCTQWKRECQPHALRKQGNVELNWNIQQSFKWSIHNNTLPRCNEACSGTEKNKDHLDKDIDMTSFLSAIARELLFILPSWKQHGNPSE